MLQSLPTQAKIMYQQVADEDESVEQLLQKLARKGTKVKVISDKPKKVDSDDSMVDEIGDDFDSQEEKNKGGDAAVSGADS